MPYWTSTTAELPPRSPPPPVTKSARKKVAAPETALPPETSWLYRTAIRPDPSSTAPPEEAGWMPTTGACRECLCPAGRLLSRRAVRSMPLRGHDQDARVSLLQVAFDKDEQQAGCLVHHDHGVIAVLV